MGSYIIISFLVVTEETVSLAAGPSIADDEPVQFTTLEKVTIRIES